MSKKSPSCLWLIPVFVLLYFFIVFLNAPKKCKCQTCSDKSCTICTCHEQNCGDKHCEAKK